MGHEGLKTVMPFIERVLGGEQVEYEAEVPFETSARDLCFSASRV